MNRRSSAGRVAAVVVRVVVLVVVTVATGALVACEPSDDSERLVPGESLELPVLLGGHDEVAVEGDRPWPLYAAGDRVSYCARPDPLLDTSAWRGRVWVDGVLAAVAEPEDRDEEPAIDDPDAPRPPSRRGSDALCFDAAVPPLHEDARSAARVQGTTRPLEICARVVDRADGSRVELPCVEARRLLDPSLRDALEARRRALMETRYELSTGELLARLDDLREEARAADLPLLATRLDLIAVHFLDRSGEPASLERAERRLEELPPWIEHEATGWLAASALYQRAVHGLDAGASLGHVHELLLRADARLRRLVEGREVVALGLATVLSRAGALDEALRVMEEALGPCVEAEQLPQCRGPMTRAGRNELAWLVLLDPLADRDDLERAGALLELAVEDHEDPLARANYGLNLALVELRLGRDPRPTLERARAILDRPEHRATGARQRVLDGWARLLEGLAALEQGRFDEARALCGALERRGDPRLAAWSASCVGRAARATGDLGASAAAFDRALEQHEIAGDPGLAQTLPLGHDTRADDFARAARVAVERGRPGDAWHLLLRLDALSVAEAERRRCRADASPAERARWREIDRESRDLLDTLRRVDEAPASLERRRQRAEQARALGARLRALWRERPGCGVADGFADGLAEGLADGLDGPDGDPSRAARRADAGLDVRAVALEDEILTLWRRGDTRSKIETGARSIAVERTPLARDSLADRLASLSDGAVLDVEPLARALVPDALLRSSPAASSPAASSSGPRPRVWALHGPLQDVPLVALPVEVDGGARRLGQVLPAAVQPAAAVAANLPSAGKGDAAPLFVLDPRGDLGASAGLLELARERFPEARTLVGDDATHAAVRGALGDAAWLHVDAHGDYDPSLPELSSLRLADRPLRWLELAETTPRLLFANLAGCQTGRWPVTADSGIHGLGGLLTRLGVPWAIASRTDLPDAVAGRFNRAFYAAIADGAPVPESFRRGVDELARHEPASRWAGLVLLHAAGASRGDARVVARDLDGEVKRAVVATPASMRERRYGG